MRQIDREIRGVVIGTSGACGYIGQFIFCVVGGWLFDNVSPGSPFIFVGVLDFIFAIAVIILGFLGVIKNDITIRKAQEALINEQRRKIELEINAAETSSSITTTTGNNEVNDEPSTTANKLYSINDAAVSAIE